MKYTPNHRQILPGRNINLFFSLFYLTLLIIIPLTFLGLSLVGVSWKDIYQILSSRRVLNAFRVSFSISFLAAFIDLVVGVVIAWCLIRYEFIGRKFLDAIVDLPFAMPTAVSGIALAAIYSNNGWLGKYLESFGLKVSYTPFGILIALIFVGLPFVIRAVQPAVQALDYEMEEAAASLGASRGVTLLKVIIPQLLPSMIAGFTMSLARGLGEYGSVIFIAGNIPFISEVVPLLIVIELEQFNYEAATILAVTMLVASFFLLVALGFFGKFLRRKYH